MAATQPPRYAAGSNREVIMEKDTSRGYAYLIGHISRGERAGILCHKSINAKSDFCYLFSFSMTEENAHEKKYQFDIDEKALCFHGPLIYEAKVSRQSREIMEHGIDKSWQILDRQWMDSNPDFQGPYYFVHYKGWKRTYVLVLQEPFEFF